MALPERKNKSRIPGKVKSTEISEFSLYKDNKKHQCPVCKRLVGLEHFLPGYNVPSYKHKLTEIQTTTGFYYYGNMDKF